MQGSKAILRPAKTVCYGTPRWLYDYLNDRYHFTYDPCPLNDAKIWDSLAESWAGQRVYCNPPYGRAITAWLSKRLEPDLSVYLLPARTDTEWWHELVMKDASEVTFLRNRIRFQGMTAPAPFPSVIVLWERHLIQHLKPRIESLWLTKLEEGSGRGYSVGAAET